MMTGSETLFNPQNDSLAEKVKVYSEICRDYARVQASLKLEREGKSVDYIGDIAQMKSAHEVIEKSLTDASKEISSDDIQRANKQGLLSKDQFARITKYRRQKEMETNRRQNITTNSSTSNLKR